MDPTLKETTAPRSLRRSTRQSAGKALSFEPTPRGPLKRTKRVSENRAPVAAVNGSRDEESGAEDGESPSKKSRLETAGDHGRSGDENEMDVEESPEDLEKDEDQEMAVAQDSSQEPQSKLCQGDLGDVNLFPRVELGERCRANHDEARRVKPSTKGLEASAKSASQIRSPATKHEPKVTSMDEYRRTMEDKIKNTGAPTVKNHIQSMYPASQKSYTTRQRMNYIPSQKETVQHKKQGIKKTADVKRGSAHSSRGIAWYFWRLVLMMLLGSFAVLLANKIIPVLQRTADGGERSSRAVKSEEFAAHLTLLQAQFPSQRPDLWKRSKIHLEKHLRTVQPTEPVSLIFTAGLRAESTLRCLAQGLASAYSSALNGSVLHIDGASKTGQDSNEVKLDIDTQLQAAFEGDKPVAVIHRIEELPPGSTIIFYRYCDHENSAYKQVFLLFTVLLPQDEVSRELSLKDVEEMVQDYVKEKLVDSSSQTDFNKMDADKYGGLWSRISHLVLPVVSEKEVEQRGC